MPTWSGTVYVAPRHWARTNGAFNGSMIDVFARRIVGWRASTSMKTQFVLDALEQATWKRKTPDNKSLVHHSGRGSQYLSIKYTERLASAEIDLSVGTVGDAYDNALAECVIGLFKTEVINQTGPWKSMREVEWETLNRRTAQRNGSIGITIVACSALSATSHPLKQRRRSMQT